MKVERPVARAALTLAALVVALASAVPAGRALGDWVMFGSGHFAAELTRRWMLVPCVAVLVAAGLTVARRARSRLWLAAPLLILVLLGLGAWQAVGERVDVYRDGPLNAAL
jgi:hypothetical protein